MSKPTRQLGQGVPARVRRGLGALPSAPGAGNGQVKDSAGTAVVGPSRLCQVSLLRIALHLQDYMSLLRKEGVKRVFFIKLYSVYYSKCFRNSNSFYNPRYSYYFYFR